MMDIKLPFHVSDDSLSWLALVGGLIGVLLLFAGGSIGMLAFALALLGGSVSWGWLKLQAMNVNVHVAKYKDKDVPETDTDTAPQDHDLHPPPPDHIDVVDEDLPQSVETVQEVKEEEEVVETVVNATPVDKVELDEAAVVNAVKLQAFYRGFAARAEFKRLMKWNRRRNHIMREIIETEKSYVGSLEKTVEFFLRPLQNKEILTRDQIRMVFSDIEIILSYNRTLLQSLNERWDTWGPSQRVGDVFLSMAAFLKVYTAYVSSFSNSMTALSQAKKKSKDFASFLQKAAQNPATPLDLSSYLIMVVQRIPRYRLLLDDLLKHTWDWHSDYIALQKSLGIIESVAQYVNEKKREAENMSKVLTIQEQFKGLTQELAIPTRRYVTEVVMSVMRKGKGSVLVPGTKVHAFLFSDLLLLATEYRKGSMFTSSKQDARVRFKAHISFPLRSTTVVRPFNSIDVSKGDGESEKEGEGDGDGGYYAFAVGESWSIESNVNIGPSSASTTSTSTHTAPTPNPSSTSAGSVSSPLPLTPPDTDREKEKEKEVRNKSLELDHTESRSRRLSFDRRNKEKEVCGDDCVALCSQSRMERDGFVEEVKSVILEIGEREYSRRTDQDFVIASK